MAANFLFTKEDMVVDEDLGYPKAYAKLCRDRSISPYSYGPPFTFTPYTLQPDEGLRARELDQMFAIINPKGKPTTKPKIFVSLLWKQLNHLGNAGFDPEIFRVDPYGNVLYYHADSASPLAWDVDHWFPCSRGGTTVPSNLRILQWQVCKKKHNKLEFLVPWWDLQLGISANQFLSIFASPNSYFRHRAFTMLFFEGENEELNASQTVDSHTFPQHFIESKERLGLAPAAIVLSRREFHDDSSALKSPDFNKQRRPNSAIIAARKLKPGNISKENEVQDMVTNPYQAIVMARDSLKQREETTKVQAEIQKLDDEVLELNQKNEEEKIALQDLELVLIKRKRRAEKCRRLAEAQCSYRAMLEKMIRDAMHQSVIYKEQLRLNQAASNALMARLEAQKAICNSSEKELHKKFKQKDEIEKQLRPEWEQARKRSRVDDMLFEEGDNKTLLSLPDSKPRIRRSNMDDALFEQRLKTALYLPETKPTTPSHKELRVFLEEEQKASEADLCLNEERKREEIEEDEKELVKDIAGEKLKECEKSIVVMENESLIEDKLQALDIGEESKKYNIQIPVIHESEIEEDEESRRRLVKGNIESKKYNIQIPVIQESDIEEDEESRTQRGKGNVEKWLQMLLENSREDSGPQNANEHETRRTDEIFRKMDLMYPPNKIKILRSPESKGKENIPVENKQQTALERDDGENRKEEIFDVDARKAMTKKNSASELGSVGKKFGSRLSFEGKETKEKSGRSLVRSESARAFRPIPTSPYAILGMKKGADCKGKKPMVASDDDEAVVGNSFIKSSIRTIKKAVKM